MAKVAESVEQLFTSKSLDISRTYQIDQLPHWQTEIEDLSKNPPGDAIEEHRQIDELLCGLIKAEKGLFVLMCLHSN